MFSQTRIRSPAKYERAIHVRLSDCHRRNSRAADGLQSHRPFPARRRRENIGASSSIMRMRELPPRPPNQQILDLCSHHVCECPARCSPLPARSLYGGAGFFGVNMDVHTLIQGLANTLDAELRKQAETFLEEVSGGRVACSLGRF